jgi:peptidylprolyl isomerase
MGTQKRQRKKDGRQARLEAERAAAARAQRRRRLVTAAVVAAAVFAVLVLLAGGGDDDGDDDPVAAGDTAAQPQQQEQEGEEEGADVDLSDKPAVEVPEGEPPGELVVEDVEEGDGEVAEAGDTVEVHYVGVSYSTGEEFDASWDRGDTFPFELGAGQVIPGWDQGVEGMRVGGQRRLVIPPELAYGEEGRPPAIAPNETLVFVVDLVDVG